MSKSELETIINQAWDKKEEVNKNSDKKIIDAILSANVPAIFPGKDLFKSSLE